MCSAGVGGGGDEVARQLMVLVGYSLPYQQQNDSIFKRAVM